MANKVVLAGIGKIGKQVLNALLEHKDEFQVVVLSRKENKELEAKGITVIVVDYSNVAQLTDAVKGAYVVISLIDPVEREAALKSNVNLLQATKQAGVKKFIPSEWGSNPAITFPAFYYQSKWDFRKLVEESGLEYTLIGTGIFTDIFDAFSFILNLKEKKATLIAPGDQKVGIIHAEDIGKIAVAVLRYKGKWPKIINVTGERTTWNQVIATAEKVTGSKFQVEYKTEAEFEDWAKKPGNELASFSVPLLNGSWAIPQDADSDKIVEGIKFSSVEDYLRSGNKQNLLSGFSFQWSS